MKTLEELKKMDSKKMLEELMELENAYFKVKFEVKNGQSKNNHLIRSNRRQIARIKTLMANSVKSK